eukprot:9649967-Heterocapsa_arctica.AAC.1
MALGCQPLDDGTGPEAFWLSGPLPASASFIEPRDAEDVPVKQGACLPLAVTEEVALSAFDETRTARIRRHKRRKLHGNWTSKEAEQHEK